MNRFCVAWIRYYSCRKKKKSQSSKWIQFVKSFSSNCLAFVEEANFVVPLMLSHICLEIIILYSINRVLCMASVRACVRAWYYCAAATVVHRSLCGYCTEIADSVPFGLDCTRVASSLDTFLKVAKNSLITKNSGEV